MTNAKRDANRVPVMIGVSSVDGVTPTPVYVNPATGGVLAEVTPKSYLGTSTTSLAIATGSKTFTTQSGLPYSVGLRLRASSDADPADYMEGVVTAYSGTSLTILVDNIGGSGTDADWNINIAGDVGDTGATGATGPTGPAGAGRRSATLVIAASNSKDTDVASSDYQCDGTADQTEIEAAVAALPSGGGRIVLMEGTYTVNAAIDITKSNVTLEGQGVSTILYLANSSNVNVLNIGSGVTAYNKICIKNLKIDGNASNQTTNGHGIQLNSGVNDSIIDSCFITNTYKANIYWDRSDYCRVINCYLSLSNNNWACIERCGYLGIISGNHFTSCDYAAVYTYAENGYGMIISNNIIDGCNEYGIYIEGSTRCQILNNNISDFSNGSANTYSGIYLNNSSGVYSEYNIVSNNFIDGSGGSYCIEEESVDDGPNIIINNICINATTGQILAKHVSTDVSHNITV